MKGVVTFASYVLLGLYDLEKFGNKLFPTLFGKQPNREATFNMWGWLMKHPFPLIFGELVILSYFRENSLKEKL